MQDIFTDESIEIPYEKKVAVAESRPLSAILHDDKKKDTMNAVSEEQPNRHSKTRLSFTILRDLKKERDAIIGDQSNRHPKNMLSFAGYIH